MAHRGADSAGAGTGNAVRREPGHDPSGAGRAGKGWVVDPSTWQRHVRQPESDAADSRFQFAYHLFGPSEADGFPGVIDNPGSGNVSQAAASGDGTSAAWPQRRRGLPETPASDQRAADGDQPFV